MSEARRQFQRWPARGARGYAGGPPTRVVPAKHRAEVSFEPDNEGRTNVIIELDNRGGSVAEFSFEGLETEDVVSLDGSAKTVVFYVLEFGAESVTVTANGSLLVEETVPNGGSL